MTTTTLVPHEHNIFTRSFAALRSTTTHSSTALIVICHWGELGRGFMKYDKREEGPSCSMGPSAAMCVCARRYVWISPPPCSVRVERDLDSTKSGRSAGHSCIFSANGFGGRGPSQPTPPPLSFLFAVPAASFPSLPFGMACPTSISSSPSPQTAHAISSVSPFFSPPPFHPTPLPPPSVVSLFYCRCYMGICWVDDRIKSPPSRLGPIISVCSSFLLPYFDTREERYVISPVQASLIVHVSWDFLETLVNSVLTGRCPGKEKRRRAAPVSFLSGMA